MSLVSNFRVEQFNNTNTSDYQYIQTVNVSDAWRADVEASANHCPNDQELQLEIVLDARDHSDGVGIASVEERRDVNVLTLTVM